MTNPNDFAFSSDLTQFIPTDINDLKVERPPLTKREYFAAMAMQGLITNGWNPSMAKTCVKAADELINALNKQQHGS